MNQCPHKQMRSRTPDLNSTSGTVGVFTSGLKTYMRACCRSSEWKKKKKKKVVPQTNLAYVSNHSSGFSKIHALFTGCFCLINMQMCPNPRAILMLFGGKCRNVLKLTESDKTFVSVWALWSSRFFQHRTQGYIFLVPLEALVAEHGFMWLLCVLILLIYFFSMISLSVWSGKI